MKSQQLADSKIKGQGRSGRQDVEGSCNRPNFPRFQRTRRHKVDQLAGIMSAVGWREGEGGGQLSWPSWLTYSGRFTHISGHPSAVGRAQDSESSPVKDQRSTAEPQNQPSVTQPVSCGGRNATVRDWKPYI